jgi:glyoxylase-like metal-dependent hydrolase (beta-lactamase superfamily II)
MAPDVLPRFHRDTGTWSYLVWDPSTRVAAIIDPVLDFDPASGRTSTASAAALRDAARERELDVTWILETHAHADHLTAAQWLRAEFASSRVAIGEGIREVQSTFGTLFNLGPKFARNGSQFDHLFADGDALVLGNVTGRVIAVPGHTNDSVAYLIGDALFTGDSIFMPDGGTARCDFPGGDAARLYQSIWRLYQLPETTRVFVCHDYMPGGREPQCESTIGAQRNGNIHVRDGIDEATFVGLRTARDATLAMPQLILPSVQVNIRAGRFPPAEDNGTSYLKLPLDRL